MSKDSSGKYQKDRKERLQKRILKGTKFLPKRKKKASTLM